MKVHTYGNVLNNAYNITRFLRAKGVDAEMFLDDTAPLGQNYPWWEHSHLSESNLPEWIRYYHVTYRDFLRRGRRFREMAADFAECDVALVCHWGPILAAEARTPYVFYSYGSDLLVAHTRRELTEAFRRMLTGHKPGLRSLLLGIKQRRCLREDAAAIGVMMGYQIENYLRPLGLLNKAVRLRLPYPVDEYEPSADLMLIQQYAKFEVVFFMVARHTWRSVWWDFKGNDKFIRAYARFLRTRGATVRLVCIDKGPDVGRSKRLIDELGIASHVEWVPEMPKQELRRYYSLPNVVVVDQFWHDRWYVRYPDDWPRPRIGFGSASIEALSSRRPLITTFFDEEFYGGERPPIFHAFSEDEIFARLGEVVDLGPSGRAEAGEAGHAFVRRFHDWSTATDLYIQQLQRVLADRKSGARPRRDAGVGELPPLTSAIRS